ncbi:MAG: hypothetical protein LBL90_11680, partial [Prevotellaceae bacterium]|nr:hypothetical protein [Prevotellaceae bacterium]
MKTKLYLWFTLVFIAYFNLSFGQGVSIGDKEFTPNAAAILDVQSQNKGVLVPRMTYVQRMYIQTNAQSTGLLVYQTDREAGFYYWDGVKWEYLAPPQTVELPNLSTVATTGNYNDLSNKPTIPTALSDLTQSEQYHTVSNGEKEYWNSAAAGANFSGNYDDLTNRPFIPTRLQDLEQDQNYYTTVSRAEREKWDAAADANVFSGSYNDLQDKPSLQTVATSGNYEDLTNKPAIPTRLQDLEQDQNYYTTVSRAEREKWDAAADANAFSGSYNDLQDKPNLQIVATSGNYEDLTNKPAIPTRLQDLEQDQNYYTTVSRAEREKWDAAAAANAFSGSYNDLQDKPSLQTVATSGNYEDLTNKPAIPTRLQDLEQDQNYYTTVS